MGLRLLEKGQRYLALSTDEKPINGVKPGAVLKETDTQNTYIFDGVDWVIEKLKSKTYKWTSETILAGEYFNVSIPCLGFDLATVFVSASGKVGVSFRATNDDGSDYSWDPLGVMNSSSKKVSAQADITGLHFVELVITNEAGVDINLDIFVYLGKIN